MILSVQSLVSVIREVRSPAISKPSLWSDQEWKKLKVEWVTFWHAPTPWGWVGLLFSPKHSPCFASCVYACWWKWQWVLSYDHEPVHLARANNSHKGFRTAGAVPRATRGPVYLQGSSQEQADREQWASISRSYWKVSPTASILVI